MKTDIKNEIKYADVAGIRMRYRIKGEGFPIIFVHGTMGSIEQEDFLAGDKARLAEKYMVMHYDCRGRGETEAGSYDTELYTWEGLADDLWALMQHVGIERAHFIGGSQGASIVSVLAVKHPECVESLILHNPVEVRKHDEEYIRGMVEYSGFIEKEGMEVVTDLILSLPPHDEMRKTHPGVIKFYDDAMRSQNQYVVAAATRALVCSKPLTGEELASIAAPVLIIAAEGDGLHPTDVGNFLADSIPNAQPYFAPTHTYFADNPEKVPAKIMEFLSQIDGVSWD